jgi:hypothetical protein
VCLSDLYVNYPRPLLILRELFTLFVHDRVSEASRYTALTSPVISSLLVPNIPTGTLFWHVPSTCDLITTRHNSIDASGEYVTSKTSRVKHFVSKM